MKTKYLDITNVVTQDDLYQVLVDTIQPIINVQQEEQKALDEEYTQQISEFTEKYTLAVKDDETVAVEKLKPHREKLDNRIKEIQARFSRLIDKETAKYEVIRKQIQEEFDNNTIGPKTIYDEDVKPFKKVYDSKTKASIDAAQEKIKPINEEYREIAKMLEERLKEGE